MFIFLYIFAIYIIRYIDIHLWIEIFVCGFTRITRSSPQVWVGQTKHTHGRLDVAGGHATFYNRSVEDIASQETLPSC